MAEAAAQAGRRIEPAGAALALEGVSSGYGAVSIVKGVSLSVGRGEIVALLGKNGMGKTTLLKTILGMVALRGGQITIGDQALAGLSPAQLVALGVGYAPQEQPLFQDLSIRDNLRLAVPSDRHAAGGAGAAVRPFPVPEGPARPAGRHAVRGRAEDADPRRAP